MIKQIICACVAALAIVSCRATKESKSANFKDKNMAKEGTSARILPMEGGFNFRDMGGIKSADGRIVKSGRVFRADELGKLTENDLAYLASIPIVTVVDFRSDSEVAASPDRTPPSMTMHYHLPIDPGNLSKVNLEELRKPEFSADKFMRELNLSLVSDPESIKQYRTFFEILLKPGSTPLIFHCTAGKDRTGMAAALFLYSLGVEEDAIMDNYLESNVLLREKYRKYIEANPSLEGLMTVKREYLLAGIDHIKKCHGTVENFLTQVLDVDLNAMKREFLH